MAQEAYTIGVDMGGTTIKAAVVQGTRILCKIEPMVTLEYPSPEAIIQELSCRVAKLREQYPNVVSIGMGLPGFADHEAGTIDSLTNVPGWYDIPIRRLLEEKTGLPAAIDNDANCMAYAEWKLGAGRGMKHLVCLTLGTGVGSGVVANDQLLRGHLGAAGEMGQTSIDYKGRVGHYGNMGAIEDYIGNRELASDAQAAYAAAGIARTLEECNPIGLENDARAGNPIALRIWDEMARKLATTLMNCCYILNPEAFIIGGGISKAGDLLFTPLRHYLRNQIYARHYERLKILPAQFGSEAGLIGAARMGLDDLH